MSDERVNALRQRWFRLGERFYVRRWRAPVLAKITAEGYPTDEEGGAEFVFLYGDRWTKHPQYLSVHEIMEAE
jgi:hypothetical protein